MYRSSATKTENIIFELLYLTNYFVLPTSYIFMTKSKLHIVILGYEATEYAVENNQQDVISDLTPATPDISQTVPAFADNVEPNSDQARPSSQVEAMPSSQVEAVPEIELDPELLSALGESTSDAPEYGDNIHDTLTKLWLPLLKKGMQLDNKNKMLKDYLVPDNCRLLQAPKLNAEISAAIPDMVRNRDKTLATSQQQLGLGITAINRGLDILLKSDDKVQAMKHLSNGCRILCDSHNTMSKNRVKLITPSLDKTFLHMINESERDETLFGSSLSEKIKAAKAIEKQGLQIKKPAPRPQKSTATSSSTRPGSFQGNWTGPPRYPPANRGGRGGYRKPQMSSVARRPYSAPTPPTQRAATQDKTRAPAQAHH